MVYIFDTNSFIVVGHFFPKQFPSFWRLFDASAAKEQIISVREVYRELDNQTSRSHLRDWIERNKEIFLIPSKAEMLFVARIFSIPHFQQLVSQKQRLKGTPVADPFIIAAAQTRNACLVTEESVKDNASRIPNICNHFHIDCTNLEGFMDREKWQF
jgi:hypothetical protein